MFMAFCSCASKKDVIYLQNVNTLSQDPALFETKLQPDDLLMIVVSAPDLEAALPFNLPVAATMAASATSMDVVNAQVRYQNYLVDAKGFIEFPVIGSIQVGGLTKVQAQEKLVKEIKKYINSPIVNLRIMNFKVSVLGEVVRPGVIDMATERITLLEAISRTGDLTIYGNRSNIMIIREIDGVKTYNYVDITSADFVKSDFYYLRQNDIVYVQPNQIKVNSSAVGPNTTVIISSVSLLITVVALIVRS